jgi:hypothetical protein
VRGVAAADRRVAGATVADDLGEEKRKGRKKKEKERVVRTRTTAGLAGDTREACGRETGSIEEHDPNISSHQSRLKPQGESQS